MNIHPYWYYPTRNPGILIPKKYSENKPQIFLISFKDPPPTQKFLVQKFKMLIRIIYQINPENKVIFTRLIWKISTIYRINPVNKPLFS